MKQWIQKYIIGTQIWVSLMMGALCFFFGLMFHSVDIKRVFIVIFSTFAGYNYIHYHASWNRSFLLRGLISVSLLFFILFYLLFKENSWHLFLHLAFISWFVFMYNSSFLRLKFRNISLVKIFVIAFTWSYSIVWIGSTGASWKEFVSIYFFILAITLPFDICDMNRDTVITIPKKIGQKNTIALSILCLVISALSFYWAQGFPNVYVWSWSLACLVSAGLIFFIRSGQFFYTRFWIEACSSFPVLVYLLIK
ncbi:hypothetical protein [Apibacter sp. HY039]|uniref:hypothetical protein n=1 Tax=Apibacter sp. HY039 TaxID=2501476 RepID=UPI000FEB9D4A|nr:hypothetical protein [Apibacter sp. HY039]